MLKTTSRRPETLGL